MSVKKPIIAVALLSAAASAHAGWRSALPESTTVTLVFIALAVAAIAMRAKRESKPVES